MKRPVFAVILAGLWSALSEFARNELVFQSSWTGHFESLGLKFQTSPANGLLWVVWSLALAFMIYRLLLRMGLLEAIAVAWLSAFVMMWIVAYNLQVLPLALLLAAVPLSLIEVAVAALIIRALSSSPPSQPLS